MGGPVCLKSKTLRSCSFVPRSPVFSAENCTVNREDGAAVAASFDAAGQQNGAGIHSRNVLVRGVVRLRRVPRVDCSQLDHLVLLRCCIRGVDICRSTLYGKASTFRAAAAFGNLERHAGNFQYRGRSTDNPRADACAEMARF